MEAVAGADPRNAKILQLKAKAKAKLEGIRGTRKAKLRAATRLQALARGKSCRRGMRGKRPDWQEVTLTGSDVEKHCTEANAKHGESSSWLRAGAQMGLQIWRIEQWRAVLWPAARHGEFHTGDSYIVLHSQQPLSAWFNGGATLSSLPYSFACHIWIGSESTADEYLSAAYLAAQLDKRLGGLVAQHREVQSNESDLFCSRFPRGLRYLRGGVASGLAHHRLQAEAAAREPVLLHVKGNAHAVRIVQVRLKRSSLNSGDAFVLDTEDGIWLWNGASASAHEKQQAAELCARLQAEDGGGGGGGGGGEGGEGGGGGSSGDGGGGGGGGGDGGDGNDGDGGGASTTAASTLMRGAGAPRVVRVLNEGTAEGDGVGPEYKYRSRHGFWRHLPGERRVLGVRFGSMSIEAATSGGADDHVRAFEPALYYASASTRAKGEPKFRCVWKASDGQAEKADRQDRPANGAAGSGHHAARPPMRLLRSDRLCLLDDGDSVTVHVGSRAAERERASAFPIAQVYLKKFNRPPSLPVVRLNERLASEADAGGFRQRFDALAQRPRRGLLGCCLGGDNEPRESFSV